MDRQRHEGSVGDERAPLYGEAVFTGCSGPSIRPIAIRPSFDWSVLEIVTRSGRSDRWCLQGGRGGGAGQALAAGRGDSGEAIGDRINVNRQKAGFADEIGNEPVWRPFVHIARRADLLHAALRHRGDAVGHGQGFFLITGDEDEGDTGGLLPLLQIDPLPWRFTASRVSTAAVTVVLIPPILSCNARTGRSRWRIPRRGIVQALQNGAEPQLAETIRWLGQAGFEGALMAFVRRAGAPDSLIIPACRGSDLPQVFSQTDSTCLEGAYLLDQLHPLHVSHVPAGLYRVTDITPAFRRSRFFAEQDHQKTLSDELTFVVWPVRGYR
ncbi:MAG: hypothetical protein IPL38_19745 [Rhodobacter sp.]|nr:hypothetical protein [Rhodobacter sp.]